MRGAQRQRALQGLRRGPPVDQRTRATTSGRIYNLGVQAHGAEPFVEPAGAGIRFVHPEVQAGGRSTFRKLGDQLAHQAAAKTMSLVLGKDVQVVEHRAPELIIVANGKPESYRRAL